MNNSLLNNFDNNTIHYDIEKYNWPSIVLEQIQARYPDVKTLETIHHALAPTEIADVTALVQNNFLDIKMSSLLDDFAREFIAPLLNDQRYLIKRQPTLNVVIPNQEAVGRRLPFHQGIFYDNGRGQGTIWMPLTECYDTNSMWVMDLESSRELTKKVIAEKMSVEQFEKHCLEHARPVNLKPGQAHLFAQEHIHGNVNNITDITRFAIDWHILIEGEEYHQRLPGAFFRMPGDYVTLNKVDIDKKFICYLSNNSEFDKHLTKHVQRCTIEKYLSQHSIHHVGWQFENEYLEHLPIFRYLLDQDVDCIVVLSMYSITDELLKLAVQKNKQIHFANEYTSMSNEKDLEKILFYKNFAVKRKGKLSFEQ